MAAKGIDGSWRVKLFSDRGAIDYVRILMFEDFSQLVDPEALNAAPLAGLLSKVPKPRTLMIMVAAVMAVLCVYNLVRLGIADQHVHLGAVWRDAHGG